VAARVVATSGATYNPAVDDSNQTSAEQDPAARKAPSVLPSNVDQVRLPSGSLVNPTQVGAPTWRVTQNPWLIGFLVLATSTLYAYWWLGRTWWQLKREDGDQGKRPVWHALAMLVPIYGYFRFYAHMKAVRDLHTGPAILQPGSMTFAWFVLSVLGYVAEQRETALWLNVLWAVLTGALFGWAQHGLNVAWRSLPGGAVEGHSHPLHWILFTLVAVLVALIALAELAGLPTGTS
jgi:hypothetical protein